MKLTDEILLEGAKLAYENAKDLIDEANLLFDTYYSPRAYGLFQLSIEEVGKASMLLEACIFNTCTTQKESNKLIKEIRDHKTKTKHSQKFDLFFASLIKEVKIKKVLINNMYKQGLEIEKIDNLKNYSLYVSFLKNKFKKPKNIISYKSIENLKFYAELRYAVASQLHEICLGGIDKFKELAKNGEIEEQLLKNPPKDFVELINLIDFN